MCVLQFKYIFFINRISDITKYGVYSKMAPQSNLEKKRKLVIVIYRIRPRFYTHVLTYGQTDISVTFAQEKAIVSIIVTILKHGNSCAVYTCNFLKYPHHWLTLLDLKFNLEKASMSYNFLLNDIIGHGTQCTENDDFYYFSSAFDEIVSGIIRLLLTSC